MLSLVTLVANSYRSYAERSWRNWVVSLLEPHTPTQELVSIMAVYRQLKFRNDNAGRMYVDESPV